MSEEKEPHVVVPLELLQRTVALLAQYPYAQVADVVNELRSLEIRGDE